MSYQEFKSFEYQDTITSHSWSDQGLVVGTLDEQIYLYDSNLEQIQNLKQFPMGVLDVQINKATNNILVSSLNSQLSVVDFKSKEITQQIQCPAFSNFKCDWLKNNILTSGEGGKLLVYGQQDQELLYSYDTNNQFGVSIKTSHNQNYVALGNQLGELFVFDVQNSFKMFKVQLHNQQIRSIQFTNDSSQIITVSDDSKIQLVDLYTLKSIFTIEGHDSNINCVDVNPENSQMMLTCSLDKTVKIWDLKQKNIIQNIKTQSMNIWTAKFGTNRKISFGSEEGLLSIYMNK